MLGSRLVHGYGSGKKRWLTVVLALTLGVGVAGAVNSGMLSPARAAQSATGAAALSAASGVLNPVIPPLARALDTRTTTGGHHGKLGAGQTMKLSVLGHGAPYAGVSAVALNVTATGETARTGYLTVYPSGITRPTVSTLNYRGSVTIANSTLVRVGTDGTVSIYNSVGSTDVVVDITGWVSDDAAAASGQTSTASPVRALDTRTTLGGHKAPLGNGASVSVEVEGQGQVPAAGVSAVWANLTAVPVGTSAGYLTAYAAGASAPGVSTLNFLPGVITANTTLVPVSASGAITITNHSPGSHVLVDIVGWTSGGDVTGDAGIATLPPQRVLDTRTTLGGHHGAVGAGGIVSVKVLGVGGVPASGVGGVIAHITGVGLAGARGSYLTGFGAGLPRAASSTLNLTGSGAASNTVALPVGVAGGVSVFNSAGSVQVIVDIQGWIAAPVLTGTGPSAAALGATPAPAVSPSATPAAATDTSQAKTILNNANKYGVTTWWHTVYPALAGTNLRVQAQLSPDNVPALSIRPSATTAVNTGDSVRRMCMEAYSLATSIATGAYDPAATGVPVATATSHTVQVISTVVAAHYANKAGGWGFATQTTFVAAYCGEAAWLLWSHLSGAQQSQVLKMVYAEAEWGTDYPLIFYANAAGTVIVDEATGTGADGDSWMPMAAQLATMLMPGNAHVAIWQNAIVRDAIDAWARPSDDANATGVNGARVATWIGNRGSNVLAAGYLINHGRVAPDYSSLIYQNMQDILVAGFAGKPAPQAITALVRPLYASYTGTKFASPPYLSPGGTVYTPGSAKIYYPQGIDWGPIQYLPYALADAQTAVFGVSASPSANATWQNLHASAELALQTRAGHTDGHTYDSDTEYRYVGREEHVAQLAAQYYSTLYLRDNNLVPATDTSSYWLAP